MNLYVTPNEIKDAIPDSIRSTTTSYDSLLYRLAERVSRMIDRHCFRHFYPLIETRYFDGDGGTELWVRDLLEITTIHYSPDNGKNYTAYTANDYMGWLYMKTNNILPGVIFHFLANLVYQN